MMMNICLLNQAMTTIYFILGNIFSILIYVNAMTRHAPAAGPERLYLPHRARKLAGAHRAYQFKI